MKNFLNFFLTAPIFIATTLPFVIGLAFLFVWYLFLFVLFGNSFSESVLGIGWVVAAFFAGFGGVIEIKRRDFPVFGRNSPARGKVAVGIGIITTLICWAIGVVLLYFVVTGK